MYYVDYSNLLPRVRESEDGALTREQATQAVLAALYAQRETIDRAIDSVLSGIRESA